MHKRQSYTRKEQLDRRALNILDEMDGVGNLLQFYYKNHSFLSVEKVGVSTNEQLCSFCEYLESVDTEKPKIDIVDKIDEVDIDRYIRIYEIEKSMLSVRVNNVLDKLEADHKYAESKENKLQFLNKVFSKKFDFFTIRNLGLKSVNELVGLRDKIIVGNPDEEPVNDEGLKLKGFLSKDIRIEVLLGEHEKEEFVINGEYCFEKILCVFLLTTSVIKEKYHGVMRNRYFSDTYLDRRELSKFIQITPERIRQVEINLKETLLPLAINLVREGLGIEFDEIGKFNQKNFGELNDFEHFSFKGNAITPNSELSKFVYQEIYSGYLFIEDFIKADSKSFEILKTNMFISKAFIARTHFIKLLEWADEQIYSFEIISFEYNMEILIQRYYHEHNYVIEKEELKDLYSIFKFIKKVVIEVKQNVRLRFENKAEKETIINEVYLFLKEKGEGQSTNDILNHLKEINHEIKKTDLLRILYNNAGTFSFLGMGNWNLKEWNKVVGQARGNFMQLIRNLLLTSNEPLHISELHAFINTIKKVSIHSLSSNLKLETKGTFKFFNCSYIGLTEKVYEDFWYRIPKYRPVHLNKFALSENHNDNLKRVKLLCSKYGYPEKHLLFLLDCRNGKYQL